MQGHDEHDARRRVRIDFPVFQAQHVLEKPVDQPAGRTDDDPRHGENEGRKKKAETDQGSDRRGATKIGAMHDDGDGRAKNGRDETCRNADADGRDKGACDAG